MVYGRANMPNIDYWPIAFGHLTIYLDKFRMTAVRVCNGR